MKIALCLFGNVGHKQMQGVRKKRAGFDSMKEAFNPPKAWSHPARAHKAFERLIVAPYDTDVFIHSWSTDFKDELLKLYTPKKHEIVEQTQFGSNISKYGLIGPDMTLWKLSKSAMASYKLLLQSRGSTQAIMDEIEELTFRTESRWWSSKRVLEQKKEYEDQHGFKYDFVVISRLDNIFKTAIPFNKLDRTKFYGSQRIKKADKSYAYFDYWFISGSENMDQFATLYDERYNYSVRPTFACREHIIRKIGSNAIAFLFTHNKDYILSRDLK